MRKLLKSNHGITMLEMMIGVVIIGITASMAVPRFMTAIDRMNFKSANREVISTIREARSLAISTRVPHGVYFDGAGGQMVLFKKDTSTADSTYVDGSDSVLVTETFTGEEGVNGEELDYCGSTFFNNVALFYPNGSVSSSGYAWTYRATQDMVGVAVFRLLQSTGKLETIWEIY